MPFGKTVKLIFLTPSLSFNDLKGKSQFVALGAKRKLGRVNFRKDFWDSYSWPIASPVTVPESMAGHISAAVAFSFLKWRIGIVCYTRQFAMTIFSATQHYSIVATLFRMVATLFQHCNAVLRWKSSLYLVSCNMIFKVMLHETIRNDDF